MTSHDFLNRAIALAFDNVAQGGRPFGAVVVKGGRVIAQGVNRMHLDHDPTAHAELLSLRSAAQVLGTTRLEGCEIYASGQPCPMCLAAIKMAGIRSITFGYSNQQAEPFGLSTAAVATELAKPVDQQNDWVIRHCPPSSDQGDDLYATWQAMNTPGNQPTP